MHMSAIALVMVAVTATLMLAALSPAATDLQPSAQRVLVTSVIALIAPLFWPGKAKTPERTALTIMAWSGAVTLLAVTTLLLHRASGQSLTLIVMPCMMLLLIMLVTHAVTAGLELIMTTSSDADVARASAGTLSSIGLATLGSLPLWLGPAAELAGEFSAALIDGVIAVSPLTHLAVASGNDLFRNQWFYQHSNLAALRYSYPGMTTVTAAYIAIIPLLLVSLAVRFKGRTTFLQPNTERFK
jgi:hypothetical protein